MRQPVLPTVGHPGQAVELTPVPVLAVQRIDRTGVVEKTVRIGDLGVEFEPVGDIRPTVTVVIDVDLVAHVVAELEEIRAPGRELQRHVVGDQRDRVGAVGADERVQIGAVGDRILGYLRGLAV
ncbi:hypothetical protein GCM10027614_37190 [Micromonospora vulcania]